MALHFKAGNAAGMDAASAVIVKAVFCGKGRTVGMAGNQYMVFLFGPVMEPFFRFMLSRIVFGRAGGIENAEMFQGLP